MAPTNPIPAYETFRSILVSLLNFDTNDEAMLRDIYDASKPFLNDGIGVDLIPDILSGSASAPESYKNYMKNFRNIKTLDIGITTIADLNSARSTYKDTLRRFGLNELANNDNVDQFLTNRVSAQEAADRISVAYDAINNADEALKSQLSTYFPSLSGTDLAKSLLGVGKSASELQKTIQVAGIKAESASAGLNTSLNPEDLVAQGVTREAARQGFQKTMQELNPLTAAAQRAGIETTNLQNELESENLLGMASQRRKRITQAEANAFSGSSGTGSPSLNRAAAGSF
jgi:hypothetical protein